MSVAEQFAEYAIRKAEKNKITITLIIKDIGTSDDQNDRFSFDEIKNYLIQENNLKEIKNELENMILKEQKEIIFHKLVNNKIKTFKRNCFVFILNTTPEKRAILFDFVSSIEKEWKGILDFTLI